MITRQKTAVHLLLISLILFGIAWYLMSSLTSFSSDDGLRLIQIQELIKNKYSSLAVSYPARILDPELDFTPFYYAYSIIDDEILLQITAFLPLITAIFYPLLGTFALPLIPVAGGVLTATAVFYMGKIVEIKRPYLLLWSTVFATPLFFYSLVFWDHSIAVACALWATAGLARSLQTKQWKPAFYGGLALGFGLGQRPEIYVYAIALGIAAILLSWHQWRAILALIAGSFLTAIPVWLFQWRGTGHPLGMAFAPHLLKYGIPDAYPFSGTESYPRFIHISRFILNVQAKDDIIFLAAMLILFGIFLTIFSVRMPRLQKSRVLWLAFSITILGYFLMIGSTWGEPLPGILTTFPLIAFSLVYLDKKQDKTDGHPVYLLALITTFLFFGIMIAVWPASGGKQWGARYLLPAYPLLIFLAFYVITINIPLLPTAYSRTCKQVAIGLLVSAILLQGYSIFLLYQEHQNVIKVRTNIHNLPAELILTNHPYLPSFMASLEDKQFLYIDDSEDLQILVPRLLHENIDRFALVTFEFLPISVPSRVDDININKVDFSKINTQVESGIYSLETIPKSETDNE